MQIKSQIAAFLLVLKGFKVDFSFNLQATVVSMEDLLVESLLGSVQLNLTGNKILVDTKNKQI